MHLRTALVEAATAASHKNGSYRKDKFFRSKAKRGHKRAALGVAHKLLMAAHKFLSTGKEYEDLGANYLDQLDEHRVAANLVRRFERRGFSVPLTHNSSPEPPPQRPAAQPDAASTRASAA